MFVRKLISVALAVVVALALMPAAFAGHTPPDDPKGDPWDHTLGEGNDDPGGGNKPPANASGGSIILYFWGPGGKLYTVPLTIAQPAPTPFPAKAASLSRMNR